MARAVSAVQSIRIAAQKTLQETHEIIVSTAKREHAKIMAADPRPQSFSRTVDGVLGAPEEQVRPDGRIVYRYSRLEEVVRFAMDVLFDKSPVLSGAYRQAHTLFLNGVAVADLRDWKAGDEITISNPLPYSRKIELGKMRMRVSGTDEVYQQARAIVSRRYGNVASIKFTYRAFIGGGQVNQALAPSTGKAWWLGNDGTARAASGLFETRIARDFGKTAHNKSDVRFPVLVIREL